MGHTQMMTSSTKLSETCIHTFLTTPLFLIWDVDGVDQQPRKMKSIAMCMVLLTHYNNSNTMTKSLSYLMSTNFIPQQDYDIAIFIESLTHFTNPSQVLANIRPYTNKIIIKDHIYYQDFYNPVWQMHFRPIDSFKHLIQQHYNIQIIEEDKQIDVYNSYLFWYNNISKLNPNQITNQIKTLYQFSKKIIQRGPEIDKIKVVTIVAT